MKTSSSRAAFPFSSEGAESYGVADKRNKRGCLLGLAKALVLCCLTACSGGPTAKSLITGSVTWNRQTAPGTEVLVRPYGEFSKSCMPTGAPTILVYMPPEHGKVSIRPGFFLFTRFGAEVFYCSPGEYQGVGVFYKPDPGFVGTDDFRYEVEFGTVSQRATAVISVTR